MVGGNTDVALLADEKQSVFKETTKSKVIISNLQSGMVYYFRIMVVNSAGMGPKSETISIKVY